MAEVTGLAAGELVASDEFRRIQDIPIYDWAADPLFPKLAEIAANKFLTPRGRAEGYELFPEQAALLVALMIGHRAVGILDIGSGKTLTSGLIGTAMGLPGHEVVLLVPSSLVGKTHNELQEWAQFFRVSHPHILGYSKLSTVKSADPDAPNILDLMAPKVIVADEAHMLASEKSARTLVVKRYMRRHRQTRFVPLTGTFMPNGPGDGAHLLQWALRDHSVLPSTVEERTLWHLALCAKIPGKKERPAPGALTALHAIEPAYHPGPRPQNSAAAAKYELKVARLAFGHRLLATPGVIATKAPPTSVPLTVELSRPELQREDVLAEQMAYMRENEETLDGAPFESPMDAWRHARELVCGLHYVWVTPPPDEWRELRKQANAIIRSHIGERMYPNPQSVWEAFRQNLLQLEPFAEAILNAWLEIKPTYVPQTRPEWGNYSMLAYAATWLEQNPVGGIVWVEHTYFGDALSLATGVPYFSSGQGESIQQHQKSMIASVAAHGTGRNLQRHHHKNLVISYMPTATTLNQLIGRTFRAGQTRPVSVEVVCVCHEQWSGWIGTNAQCEWQRDGLLRNVIIHQAQLQAIRPRNLI